MSKTQNPASKATKQTKAPKAPSYPGRFFASLNRNNASIKADRAADLTEGARLQYKRKVEDLEQQINVLKRRREAALDLSPDTAISLKHAANFDEKAFVASDIAMSIEIRNLSIELKLTKGRYKSLFEGDPDSPDEEEEEENLLGDIE